MSSTSALLIGDIVHVKDEWRSLAPKITLQVRRVDPSITNLADKIKGI